jgi:hypothetical protein
VVLAHAEGAFSLDDLMGAATTASPPTGDAIEGMRRLQPLAHSHPIELDEPDPHAGTYRIRPSWTIDITADRRLIALTAPRSLSAL